MIDTIVIYLNKNKLSGKKAPFDLIESKLLNPKYRVDNRTTKNIVSIEGKLSNFYIKSTKDYIKLNGSLCKLYKGNNHETLQRFEILPAIEKLKTLVGLPIERGYIRRIDFGRNFEVEQEAQNYFDVLMETSKYRRNFGISELKYFRSDFVLSFYDKGKEMADKLSFKQGYKDKINRSKTLRYELKIEGNVARHCHCNRSRSYFRRKRHEIRKH